MKRVLWPLLSILVLAPPAWAGWYLMIPPPPPDLGQSGKWESLGEPVSTRWWIERSFDKAADCEAVRSRDVRQAKDRLQTWRERQSLQGQTSTQDRGNPIPVELILEIQHSGALCIATDDPRLAAPGR